MNRQRVLFVCVHNSARSQMAEAYLNFFGNEKFEAESAGLEPGSLNPFVVEVMKEDEIDISGNKTKSVFDFFKQGKMYGYVITVCDETTAERCPIFPGVCERLHWSFADPAAIEGTYEEKLAGTRMIRDQIKFKIKDWIREVESKFIVEDGGN
ncbi:MAG: arsenate reductase ArsC [Bacteroidetes bacterium]|nr:arsenate reductase ArsC [Bacteroidota bacterium]